MPVTSAMVEAIMTPTPWVPRSSLMMQGSPPTISTAAGTSSRKRTMAVRGMSMPKRERSCSARSLSRERAMGMALLQIGTPMRSSWFTTERP